MATTFSYQVSNLLEKMSSPDKDFRFMATNDLMAELQKDAITLDDDTERKVVKTLLKLLDDKNGEVQNLAVRCLAPLVHKIKTQQLETMVDTLCLNMESQSDRLRDVSSIALKTVMAELPGGAAATSVSCVRRVIPRLTEGLCIENKTDASVKLEILDILNNVIKRFGRSFGLNFEEIERAVFMQLEKERQALRKRSIQTLGALVDVVPNDHYDRIVQKVVTGCVENAKNTNNLRTYVSAATSICRNSPARFADFLPKFVPQFIEFCQHNDDDELREACLQAFETFITRCTKDLTPFMSEIIKITSQLVKYDPNYHYDDDANGTMMETDEMSNGDEEEDDDGDGDDADEYSDDDDLSWKVRRAAAKCIEALITYHPDLLYDNYNILGPLLISRFKEREENVKYDIYQAYTSLLKQTRLLIPEYFHKRQQAYNLSADVGGEQIRLDQFQKFIQEELGADQRRIFDILSQQSPNLIRAIYAQLKGRNLKTRQQCFLLLSHLLQALPGALTNSFQLMIVPIQSTLNDKTADGNMKINTLQFIDVSLRTHDSKSLVSFINAVTPLVVKAIQDPFYKISAEALTVTMSLIRVLQPLCTEMTDTQCDCARHVSQIYSAIVAKLKISDVDQEVKEKTISATGLLVSIFAEQGDVKLSECLPLLLERLRNEMTRYVTVRALNTIVGSQLKIAEISKILPDVLPLLAEFLRKNQRTLRITTLTLLESLVTKFSQGGLENSGLVRVVKEVPNLISEQDLQISLLSLRFITDVINAYPDQLSDSLPNLFNSLINLTQSSLLQGATLNAALSLFAALVKSPLPNKPSFEEIVDRLSSVAYEARPQLLHRQAYISIAKSVAVVAHAHSDVGKANKLITKLQALLNNDSQSDSVRLFAILTLGELGRIYSSVFNSVNIQPETLIISSFNCHLEEIKTAASYALGSLAVGNLAKFLPFLLKEINDNPKRQYLLLHALKEVISSESSAEVSENNQIFRAGVQQIWQLLVSHCSCEEEGTRNIVAECLGKLCLIEPQRFLPDLLNRARDENSRVRGTAVTAIRFMITDHPLPVDEFLRPVIGQFLETVRDPDLQVRRVAIVTLNSAAHNKPKLIRDCLQSLLPALYSETEVKKELVYEVEMGPFKHVVDDGLDLRKAAFECMYTLAEQCIDKIDVFEYMNYVENGLKDQHDIKLLTFLMLIRISGKCALQLSQRIDRFCDLIKPQLLLKPKQNAVKQENEKQDELKRSAVRAVMALKRVPNHDRSQKLGDLVEIIRSNPDLAAMHESLERDSSMRAGGFGIGLDVMDTE